MNHNQNAKFFGIPFNGCLFLIAFGAALVLLILAPKAKAQDTQTLFSPTCIEVLSPVHYRLHFGYMSNAVEVFEVSTVANVNIGNTITTAQGTHELGYLDAYSTNSMVDNVVTFTSANDSSTIHLNTWDITMPCEVSSVLPDATPEPTPDADQYGCPAWAINGATGEKFCMWSLPRVGDYQ